MELTSVSVRLHAEELTRGVEDCLVYFPSPSVVCEFLDPGPRHGTDECGDVGEARFSTRRPAYAGGVGRLRGRIRRRHHAGERALRPRLR